MNVTNNNDNAINSYTNYCIEIHGGEVTASATGSDIGLYTGCLAVYGGKLTATSGDGYGIGFINSFDVYGGEVVGTTSSTLSPSKGIYGINATPLLTVYGGKVKATGSGINETEYNDYGSGFGCYVKSGTSGIKFYFSADGTTWGDGTGYASDTQVGYDAATGKRYAKAE